MARWIPYTFVRTVACFIAGIVMAMYTPAFPGPTGAVVGAGVMTAGYFMLARAPVRWRRRVNPGWMGLPVVALLGYLHLFGSTEARDPSHLLHLPDTVQACQVVLTGYPEARARSWRTEALVLGVHNGTWQRATGRILLYFSKEDFPAPFRYGDVLVLRGAPRKPDPPANPGEFDYRAFLAGRNIHHQHYLRAADVLKCGEAPPHRVLALAYGARRKAEEILRQYVEGERAQAVVRALVLGVTDGIDNDLRDAYAGTGAMHILAVSGLHVGVISFVVVLLLSPLKRLPHGPWWVAIAAVAILWQYAFITGLSPSVLRAVTMFSFLNMARPWRRRTNVYNTLAVSAFVMLLADPFLLRSVGFQLSYLAVLGIVYFYPRLTQLWAPSSRVGWELWKAGAVSLAAQVATTPLGLLYFHQFPVYFLLANLVVVPLSSVVLIGGLLLLPLSLFPPLAAMSGVVVTGIVDLLNGIVFFMEGLPGSVIEGIYVDLPQCVLLYGIIAAACALFHFRSFRWVWGLTVLTVAFAALQWLHFYRHVNTSRLAVYSVRGVRAVELMDKGHAYFLADSALLRDPRRIDYHIAPHRMLAGIRRVMPALPVARKLNGSIWVRWRGRTIVLVDERDFRVPPAVEIDWLIAGRNALTDPAAIAHLKCRKIILDGSNSFFYASRFLEEAKLHKLDVHSVLHAGAFVTDPEIPDHEPR